MEVDPEDYDDYELGLEGEWDDDARSCGSCDECEGDLYEDDVYFDDAGFQYCGQCWFLITDGTGEA